MSHQYSGAALGFIPTKVIYNPVNDVNGYVGYLPSDNSIYVAFRGTESPLNWQINFDSDLVNYDMFPECDCQVHKGFYEAVGTVSDDIITEIQRLQKEFPTYAVKVTGHSLGAALAQVTTMYLIKADIQVSNMINFGQPRIGDKKYAEFTKATFPDQWRVTHHQDIVPQSPSQLEGYHH